MHAIEQIYYSKFSDLNSTLFIMSSSLSHSLFQTIQIIDGVTFQVIHILSTKDLYGWHTLTYLTLHHVTPATESCGTLKLTCTTQNGYVVVWDVGKGARMACGQIHLGSVEGLAWNKTTGTLATVGSDCVVHLFQLNLACCS